MANSANAPCPCGFGSPYGDCCGLIHAGKPAPTAAQLMRSRYSAFALGLGDYLGFSWHPDTVPADFTAGDARFDEGVRWIRLIIDAAETGGLFDDEGFVAFTAIARTPEGRLVQRERSRFVRVGSERRWVYVDGISL